MGMRTTQVDFDKKTGTGPTTACRQKNYQCLSLVGAIVCWWLQWWSIHLQVIGLITFLAENVCFYIILLKWPERTTIAYVLKMDT